MPLAIGNAYLNNPETLNYLSPIINIDTLLKEVNERMNKEVHTIHSNVLGINDNQIFM